MSIRNAVALLLMAVSLLLAQPAGAAVCEYGILEAPLPGFEGQSICDVINKPTPFVNLISTLTYVFMAVIVATGIIMIVVAGYVYMTAGGSGERVSKAKGMITAALIGIILAITSIMILNTVNPQILTEPDPLVLPTIPPAGGEDSDDVGGPGDGDTASTFDTLDSLCKDIAAQCSSGSSDNVCVTADDVCGGNIV